MGSSSSYSSSSPCLLFFLFLTNIWTLTSAQLYHFCLSDNFTSNSSFSTNRDNLITSLSSLPPNDYGFYNMSFGQNGTDEHANAMALCRGDIKPDDCVSCIETAGQVLTDRCPTQKEAVIWYDNCMFRYANRSILNRIETTPSFYMWNPNNLIDTEKERFESALGILLANLRERAAAGGGRRKYASGSASATPFRELYALVQCTPDLSEDECDLCLIQIVGNVPRCCDGRPGGRWLNPSCNFRFETSLFFDPAADPGLPPESPPSLPLSPPPPANETATSVGKGNGTSNTTIISVAVPIVAVVILGACLFVFLRARKKKPKERIRSDETADDTISVQSLQFDFDSIRNATNNFSSNNKLGQGGFGAVYKGKLSNGKEIAVKRLSTNSGQGESEFKNEVMLVAKLQHRNLVRLLGFCLEGIERLLIYEFVANASLDHFIFDTNKRRQLDWETRYKIIGCVARGLLYLHEDSRLRIIHRDLKASNILLDENMTPKIADFGMARLFDVDQSTQRFTSRIAGTYGYMAPEYAMHGQFSVKTDVFSFGVLVLEIVSGQRNNCFRNGENVEDLLSFAWRSWRDGTALNMVDTYLKSASRDKIMRCIHIGLLCVQENVTNRPTMASIVMMLNSHSLSLPKPTQCAFFRHSNARSAASSSSDSMTTDASITESHPLRANHVS